ncbi:hypothetical protein [Lentzea atacamensis]|uniref:hypothetical protein n=1 Tax=Lentzea atacamensis TaxID=531938 RepID=UPI001F30BDA4|nr:hypothetical protein [Lentzea atacamensis]
MAVRHRLCQIVAGSPSSTFAAGSPAVSSLLAVATHPVLGSFSAAGIMAAAAIFTC